MPLDPAVQPLFAKTPASLNSGVASSPLRRFVLFALALCLCFCIPLYGLIRLALHSELYSHILLIPFITLYLIWIQRREAGVPSSEFRVQSSKFKVLGSEFKAPLPSRFTLHASRSALLPWLAGLTLLVCYGVMRWRGWQPARDDYLAFTMLSLLLFLLGGGLVFLGGQFMRAVTFPLAMLLFMVPFPSFVKSGIEVFFQHTSADAASVLFSLSGTPVFREGLIFRLPGMTIQVAEECSGIRSSLVLFITGLLAAQLFLRTPWKRAVLALVVIPLGIVRNGFRIFTIGMLCVHVDPNMINSPIHRRGGPIFFLLSLIPFFLILVWLRRSEGKRLKANG